MCERSGLWQMHDCDVSQNRTSTHTRPRQIGPARRSSPLILERPYLHDLLNIILHFFWNFILKFQEFDIEFLILIFSFAVAPTAIVVIYIDGWPGLGWWLRWWTIPSKFIGNRDVHQIATAWKQRKREKQFGFSRVCVTFALVLNYTFTHHVAFGWIRDRKFDPNHRNHCFFINRLISEAVSWKQWFRLPTLLQSLQTTNNAKRTLELEQRIHHIIPHYHKIGERALYIGSTLLLNYKTHTDTHSHSLFAPKLHLAMCACCS